MNVNYQKLAEDSYKLATKIPHKYKYAFGIPSGGILPGYIVSKCIRAKLLSAKEINAYKGDKKDLLVVDDLIDSGRTLEDYPGYDYAVLYKKPHSPQVCRYVLKDIPAEWVSFPHEKGKTGVEDHITRLMEYWQEDPNREGLKDTPARVIAMYDEIFRGYKHKIPSLTTFKNHKDGISYDQIITDEGYFYSHCEHHLVPFFGQYYFGYIPDKFIIGLSKVARIVDHFSAKLQIQERLGEEIVNHISKTTLPKGIILQLKARHLCKEMRGVKKVRGQMTTSIIRGVFKKDTAAKEEFYHLINNKV